MSGTAIGTTPAFLAANSACSRLIAERDWSRSPLGPIDAWPQSLKTALGVVLHAPVAMTLVWGKDGIFLYNDRYAEIAGARHPDLLGLPVLEAWPEAADFNDTVLKTCLGGRALSFRDQELSLSRRGYPEQVWFDLDYMPVSDEEGVPAGVLALVSESTDWIRAERLKAAEHARLRAMFERTPGFIAMLEGPEHRFVLANAAFQALVGRTDIAGKTAREVLPEVEGQGFFELLDKVHQSGTAHVGRAVPLSIARRPGEPPEERQVDFVYQPLTGPRGDVTGIFVEGFDVTEARNEALERAEAEAALEDSRRELELLADALPVLVAYIDRNRRYRFVNKVYEAWFPHTREDIIGKHVGEVMGEEAYVSLQPRLERALAGERLTFEQFVQHKDNKHRHIRVDYLPRRRGDGAADGVFTLAQDITDAKRAEAELTELNENLERRVDAALAERKLFADIVDNTDILVLVADTEYRLLAINPAGAKAYAALFDVAPPRAGDDMLALIAHRPQDQAAIRALWEPALRGEEYSRTMTFGEGPGQRHFEARFRTLRDEAGKILGAYELVQDITARLEEQTRLREAEAALVQIQKMEAIGQLTGGIAHDFNNVLGAVLAGFELISRRADQPATVRELAEQGRAAAERGAKLTGQLLTFARAQRIQVGPVNVTGIIEDMRELLFRTLGPMVRLTLDLDPAPISVLADAVQLEMCVLNLAINARDAMPSGGALGISTRTREIENDHELPPGTYLELAVADTGHGMPPDVLQRAFDPFFTTKGVGKGTGLGLSQVYGSVRQFGGTVRIESTLDVGTTVRLLLPVTEPAPGTINAGATPRGAPAGFLATVLVVDDDDDVRAMLRSSLEVLGYNTLVASSGPAALALMAMAAPDAMLIDFAMPGMNGAELAAAVLRERPGLPIVFASGYAETAAIESAVGPNARLLRKPFRIDELQAAMQDALWSEDRGR